MEEQVHEQFEDIYTYILQSEGAFRTERVPLASNWRDWNMYEHVDRSYLLKNSKFYKGPQDYTRPFNNIIIPIANVNYRTEGFDVKDAQIYVDDNENYHKSFMARKYHERWAKDKGVDNAIDESVESYFDYGLTLLKNVNEAKPEVVQLQQIAFCDQTDVMSGPICLKHNYTIDELLDMNGKWDSEGIRKTLMMARTNKQVDQADDDQAETPGKYIEVYELHGMFPESWLGAENLGEDWEDTGKYSPQIHIVSYYISPVDGKTKNGITLFRGKQRKPLEMFKALKRDPVYGRACGRGGIEELFHAQIWTNFSEMHIHQMLEAVSKVVMVTNDKKLKNQNLTHMKHGQIVDVDDGKSLSQLAIQPINKNHFDNAVNKWEQNARVIGSASDPALGKNPTSGTPLGTTELVTQQGQGIHEYRQGKIADFWAEVYRDWVLPHLSKEIRKGSKWLDDLSLEELQDIAEKVANKEANDKIKKMIFDGKIPTKEEVDGIRELVKATFIEKGEKRFLEIMEDEFKDLSMDIKINIAGKQANTAEMVTKLNSVFRTLFTPGAIQAIQQDKGLANLLNEILETSGLSPVRFSQVTGKQTEAQPTQTPASQEELALT